MRKAGLKFKVVPSNYQEKKHRHLTPVQLVKMMAYGKARAVAKNYPNDIVIGADTVVEFKGEIMGKPRHKKDARRMLTALRGKINYVVTGVSVIHLSKKKFAHFVSRVKIVCKNYSVHVVEKYVKSGEPLDKAGAYAPEGFGKKLIKKIIGDKSAALGLPVGELKKVLKRLSEPSSPGKEKRGAIETKIKFFRH